jgi:hypothetical protein
MVEVKFSYSRGHQIKNKEDWENKIEQDINNFLAEHRNIMELSGGLEVVISKTGELEIKPYKEVFDEELRKAIEELKKAIKDW